MSDITINKPFVESISEPGIYRDSKMPGFVLKVTNTGKKVYQVRSRVRGNREKVTITIGIYGALTSTAAREKAKDVIADLAMGINPNDKNKQRLAEIEEKRTQEALVLEEKQFTLVKVLGDYFVTRDLKKGTKYNYEVVIRAYLADWLLRPANEITKEEILRRYTEITEQSGAGAANNTMRVLRALFSYASRRYKVAGKQIIAENPVTCLSELKAWQKLPRRQTLLTAHQLKPWYEAVMKLKEPVWQDFFLLLLFTGLRKNEALSLKCSDIDLDAKTILVRDTKNRQPLMLPMSDFLFELFVRRDNDTRESPYIFPGAKGGKLADPRFKVAEITRQCGITFTPHDLRRTFATVAESRDLSWKTVKALLNHKMDEDVTAGYIVTDAERLRAAMQIVTDTIKMHIELSAPMRPNLAARKRQVNVVHRESLRRLR